jgi:uncharacterized OB-fold protein
MDSHATMRPPPKPTPETLPFWAGAAAGELRMEFCNDCERYFFYPRVCCRYCGSADVEWRTLSGAGTLCSYVVDCRPGSDNPADPPVVAIVEVDEGPRLTTNLLGLDNTTRDLPLGSRVRVDFLRRGEFALPVFRLEADL